MFLRDKNERKNVKRFELNIEYQLENLGIFGGKCGVFASFTVWGEGECENYKISQQYFH